MAGAGLLAQVVVAKYADHMPLYRQAGIYRRAGIELDRATLASWVREAGYLLEPLADAVGRYVRQAQKIHTGHAGAGTGAGAREDPHGTVVDLCEG
jgi:transposase